MRIEKLRAEHYSRVAEIYQQGIDSQNCTFETSPPTWKVFEDNHLPFCRLVVLDTDNEVMGWAALSPTSSRYCFRGVAEVSIYLDQQIRGQGIGEMLLNYLVIESEKNGIWSLISGIFPENIASIKLHEKCGFKQMAYRVKMGQSSNGTFRDVLFMEKRSLVIGS